MKKPRKRPVIYQHPEMDGMSFFLEGERTQTTGFLFIHGFTATTVEVRQIANYFYQLGYTVAAPLLPGHGSTPAEMNKVSLRDWNDKVEESYSHLRMKKEKVILFGESMGALLSLFLAHNHPEIEQLFLFSPALEINGLWKSRYFWHFIPYIYKNNTDDSMAWQGYNVVPLHAARELLKLQKNVIKILPDITIPAMVFLGKNDKTINLNGGVKTFELLGSSTKKLIWLDESSHCILIDKELPKVLNIVTSRIDEIK
jgi:carboxylesterase